MARTYDQIASEYGRGFDLNFNRNMPNYHDRANTSPDSHDPLHFLVKNNPTPSENVEAASLAKLAIKVTCIMALIAGAFYILAGWYGDVVSKAGHTTDQSTKIFSIKNNFIEVPLNMVRFGHQRNSGSLDRIDLYAHWPNLEGYSEANAADFDSLEDNAPLIFISLEPQNMSREMSGRIDTIYSKFFAGPPIDAGNGLVRRAFSADSAYFSEDLYYEIDNPSPYAARCIRENDKVAASFCMRDIHVGNGLTLTYRFHASLLPKWRALEKSIRAKYNTMIAKTQG